MPKKAAPKPKQNSLIILLFALLISSILLLAVTIKEGQMEGDIQIPSLKNTPTFRMKKVVSPTPKVTNVIINKKTTK